MNEYMQSRFQGQDILRVFNSIAIPASRADIWRYCILFAEGGVYCDIDSALTIPLRQLLAEDPHEMISFEGSRWEDLLDLETYADPGTFAACPPESAPLLLDHPDHVVLNWLLCFEKGHAILRETIDLIVRHASFFVGRSFSKFWPAVVHFTGPLALTQAIWRWCRGANRRPAQYGIDFHGHGIFKIPGEEYRYRASPHYTDLRGLSIL